MKLKSKIVLSLKLIYLGMVVFASASVFAQKVDTSRISIKSRIRVQSKIPQIKANITPYKPNTFGYTLNTQSSGNTSSNTPTNKSGKIITVLKVYPNPVTDQVNINLRIDKETTLSIKITDMLGNDVVELTNERIAAGEQTKTYAIPPKLTTGIYFLKIVAGGEPVARRISVL